MSHRLPEDLERAVSKLAGRYLAARRPEQLAKCPTCGSTAEKGIAIGCCPTFDCPGGVMLTATGIAEAWVMGV